jgi:hypothetical protein
MHLRLMLFILSTEDKEVRLHTLLATTLDRAKAQAVSRPLPTAAAQVRSQVSHVGFVVDKVSTSVLEIFVRSRRSGMSPSPNFVYLPVYEFQTSKGCSSISFMSSPSVQTAVNLL